MTPKQVFLKDLRALQASEEPENPSRKEDLFRHRVGVGVMTHHKQYFKPVKL